VIRIVENENVSRWLSLGSQDGNETKALCGTVVSHGVVSWGQKENPAYVSVSNKRCANSPQMEENRFFRPRSRFQHNEKRPRQSGCPNSDTICPNSDKIYITIVTCSSSLSFFLVLMRSTTHLSLPVVDCPDCPVLASRRDVDFKTTPGKLWMTYY
jgi:hypothetical protein